MTSTPSLTSRLLLAVVSASRIKYRQFDPQRFTGPGATPRRPGAYLPPRRLGGVDVARVDRRGWPSFDVRPHGTNQPPSVLYLHGGGHAAEIQSAHWRYVAKLAVATGRGVTVPIYPLAPEHTYRDVEPTLVEIYAEICAEVLAAGGEPPVVMGDSAGASLAMSLVQALPGDLTAPNLVVLNSGSGDATLDNPAIATTQASDPLLHPDHLRELVRLYADDLPLSHPRISPINGRLDRFRRVAIYIGSRDILVHDAERLRDALTAAGAEVVFERYEGMPHDWMLMPIPEAQRQLRHVAALLTSPPDRADDPR